MNNKLNSHIGLHNLRPPEGSSHKIKRVGRGLGSGKGRYSTRGMSGQLKRSGDNSLKGFEGGQTPIYRRLPKRGFTRLDDKYFCIVSLHEIENVIKKNSVKKIEVIDLDWLKKFGVIKKRITSFKVLSDGEITVPISVKANKFSSEAIKKIEAAGGKVEIVSRELHNKQNSSEKAASHSQEKSHSKASENSNKNQDFKKNNNNLNVIDHEVKSENSEKKISGELENAEKN